MPDSEINVEELKKILSQVVWDYNISPDDLLEIFLNDKKGHALNSNQLKARLLNTYSWYKLIHLFGRDFTKGLLKEDITCYLFPKSLREKYVRTGVILS